MSYYPRLPPPPPPPPPFFGSYYDNSYDEYGFYGGYGYGCFGPPRPPPMVRSFPWRGRGRTGGWRAGAGGGSTPPAMKTEPSTPPTAMAATGAATVPGGTEPAMQSTPAAVAPAGTGGDQKSAAGTVQNGTSASARPAAAVCTASILGASTKTASPAAPASSTQTTATTSTSASAAVTLTVNESAATDADKTTDTPLSEQHPFPESVTDKFFPNRCDLCSVVFPVARDIFIPDKGGMDYMESNLQSTMHYSGKFHKKRLRQFMQDYCRRHGVSTPRRARDLMRDTPALPRASDKQETPTVDLYCKPCDLSFTSVQHASQHYAGKNHQRKMEGKPPLKSGYYNARTGRWQRLPPGMEHERPYPARPAAPATSVSRAAAAISSTTDSSVVTVQVAPGNLVNAGVKLSPAATAPAAATATAAATSGSGALSKFYCEICSVSATCQLQLDTHMTGSRHKLQARRLGLSVPTDKSAGGGTPNTDGSQPAAKRPRRDYSAYKTPSGKFYCLPCDLTMNSETQFAQHFESKKHQAEVARQRNAAATVR